MYCILLFMQREKVLSNEPKASLIIKFLEFQQQGTKAHQSTLKRYSIRNQNNSFERNMKNIVVILRSPVASTTHTSSLCLCSSHLSVFGRFHQCNQYLRHGCSSCPYIKKVIYIRSQGLIDY